MKASVFLALLAVAGAFALPSQDIETKDITTDFIINLIHRYIELIKGAGLDPLKIKNVAYEYNGNLLQLKAFVEDLQFTGASNIVINNLHNNIFLSLYDFDVVIPELSLTVGDSGIEANIWENIVSAEFRGSLSIKNIRLAGQVRYRGSLIVGVEIVSIVMQTGIGGIEADVNVIANGNDHSAAINVFLNDTLPNTLENYRNEINALLARIIMAIINRRT
ncbi:unnamed protein product [Euphydryas editha]|uniref:Uncharacterized protein n=1 Tax=Euphydryas editha TaxID=104508 RepID=A0AAU9U4I2_EUPED|nr:unnamed protein product [Euphydryas editha]